MVGREKDNFILIIIFLKKTDINCTGLNYPIPSAYKTTLICDSFQSRGEKNSVEMNSVLFYC